MIDLKGILISVIITAILCLFVYFALPEKSEGAIRGEKLRALYVESFKREQLKKIEKLEKELYGENQ